MTIPVYFIVTRDIILLDLAGPSEVFRSANLFAPDAFEQHYCGPAAELETGFSGLYLSRLEPLPAQLPANALVVLAGQVGSGPNWQEPQIRAVVDWLGQGLPGDCTLVSVCAGALLAAKAGLLRQRECTTHHTCLAQLAELEPSAGILDNRIFVQDGNIYTSAGITAGIDLALHLVARVCGPQIASATARHMVVYLRRAGQDPALSPWLKGRNHVHPAVHRVQDAILREPAADWSAADLADMAHTSARHLNRLFAEHAGCTPMDYLYRIRLALAGELIRETRLSLEQVAERAGFGSAHHLRRVWRRHAPDTPGALRADAQQGPPDNRPTGGSL
ncbi:GlxA family transcriptional regulator [Bordetella sp. FB-8]|uniref:GlxA family transcriptional regulator n=1 Tax=Bordetella sp. FB-8 TaxID=1159870 RepID=UPI00036C62F5|nr:helix-turn-helix domain-containing protein [Bordetella sp. FB-8]